MIAGLRTRVRHAPEPARRVLRTLRRQARRLRHPMLKVPAFPAVPDVAVRLLVGPTNAAGQGWAWARAAERHLPDVAAVDFAVHRSGFGFPDDYSVSTGGYGHPRWQRAQERYVVGSFSHVLLEAMRPLFGNRHGPDAAGDLEVLRRAGVDVALVFHGSDIRLPSRHAELVPHSPFHQLDDLTRRLERQARRFAQLSGDFSGPSFVSTPDLLTDLPRARWLPVVVDPDRWRSEQPVMGGRRPVVVHSPSNPRLKGSQAVEQTLAALAVGGLVEYRRLERVPNDRMPAVLAGADIVVDQLSMGLYGVAACEAMAAGRVVVSYVGETVRDRVRDEVGLEVPVVEADADSLGDIVAELVTDRDRCMRLAQEGVDFVRAVHDGRYSASVLGAWLTPPDRPVPR